MVIRPEPRAHRASSPAISPPPRIEIDIPREDQPLARGLIPPVRGAAPESWIPVAVSVDLRATILPLLVRDLDHRIGHARRHAGVSKRHERRGVYRVPLPAFQHPRFDDIAAHHLICFDNCTRLHGLSRPLPRDLNRLAPLSERGRDLGGHHTRQTDVAIARDTHVRAAGDAGRNAPDVEPVAGRRQRENDGGLDRRPFTRDGRLEVHSAIVGRPARGLRASAPVRVDGLRAPAGVDPVARHDFTVGDGHDIYDIDVCRGRDTHDARRIAAEVGGHVLRAHGPAAEPALPSGR